MISEGERIFATIPLSREIWFESGEELSTMHVFHAPDGKYDFVHLHYAILVSRDTSILGTIKQRYAVDEAGTLVWLLTMQTVGGETEIDTESELLRHYGIAATRAKFELALPPRPTDAAPK